MKEDEVVAVNRNHPDYDRMFLEADFQAKGKISAHLMRKFELERMEKIARKKMTTVERIMADERKQRDQTEYRRNKRAAKAIKEMQLK